MNTAKGYSKWIKSFILCTTLLISPAIFADNIIILSSNNLQPYQKMAKNLQANFTKTAKITSLQEFSDIYNNKQKNVIIGIGVQACDHAIKNKFTRDFIICTLIPKKSFQQLITKNDLHKSNSKMITAVFMDQPLKRQIKLARLISPNSKNLGTAFGRYSVSAREEFQALSIKEHFTPQYTFIEDFENPVQVLTPLIQRSDVFIAIPDSDEFNRNVSRWSLYITLRNKIPVIGFSENYTSAGAVVSIYSTIEQLSDQTYQFLINFKKEKKLPEADFCKEFTISINKSSAKILNLFHLDSDTLSNQLKRENK